ncbi:SMC-Scp complex subunit ScpB [Treponema sp. R6D11]
MNENFNKVLSLLFAKGEPVYYSEISEILDLPEEGVKNLVHLLKNNLENLPFDVYIFKDRAQLILKERFSKIAEKLTEPKTIKPFSKSVQETLAIIAYKQPITKQVINKIRGIDSSHSVAKLLEYELIEVAGKLDAPRSPNLYRTTDEFLRVYGLTSIEDLPKEDEPIAEEVAV